MNWVYMLRCRGGSLYTGWTNDLEGRVRAHQTGLGGKYTRAHQPVELVYCEPCDTKNAAMSREWHIKRLPRNKKLELISGKDSPLYDRDENKKN